MTKAYLKVNKTLPGNKQLEISEVTGLLFSVAYRQILENNTSDVHFDYVILNVGGTDYDLSKCTLVEITKGDNGKIVLQNNYGNISCDGAQISPSDLVKKLHEECF